LLGNPHGGEKGFARWKNAESHPDEQDLQDAADFAGKNTQGVVDSETVMFNKN